MYEHQSQQQRDSDCLKIPATTHRCKQITTSLSSNNHPRNSIHVVDWVVGYRRCFKDRPCSVFKTALLQNLSLTIKSWVEFPKFPQTRLIHTSPSPLEAHEGWTGCRAENASELSHRDLNQSYPAFRIEYTVQ